MRTSTSKIIRCAIYTRVSTDAGLDQEFNSLDAQHDAASAYIRSQAHAGWSTVRTRYDDGGFSGGSTDRPALQKLLADIKRGMIDVIVVYKVDRLTRSLSDFAKLVELFDAHSVSFVSVTQQFNTTTSMGRLTLNVLLSFAQFEREVTSERIRDKIAASKRKGLWVGGVVPLGYHARNRSISIVESEAKTVRHIFRRYLELGSITSLLTDLRKSKIVTKVRPLATGRTIGGIPFTRGPIAHLLRNRFYIGEIRYKGEIFKGEHPAIIDRTLFDTVQGKLDKQRTNQATKRLASGALLAGLIFDDRGNRMTPTYACNNGNRYRYYTSSGLIQGEPSKAGSINRVPAEEIEELVIAELQRTTRSSGSTFPPRTDDSIAFGEFVQKSVRRVDVRPDHLLLSVWGAADTGTLPDHRPQLNHPNKNKAIRIAWKKRPAKLPRQIITAPERGAAADHRPIRSETREKLVSAIARGRFWLDEILSSKKLTAAQIADREGCSVRQVHLTISLAFLSPKLVQAAVDGLLPRGIGVANLRDAPPAWSEQHAMFGLSDLP